ncbi:hypothetical protein ACFE04_001043 [Oxalis oulophora]
MSKPKQIPNILGRGLTRENYATFFSVLLDMEEIHLKEDARSHSMKSISTKMKRLLKEVFAAANKLGLGKSYLERLFEFEYYNSMNENNVTKLVTNYRCHQKILYLPSVFFYNEELIASKDYDSSSFINSVSFLPYKEFPIRFYGIQGCEESGGSISSLFNIIEASKVIEIIQELLGGGKLTKKYIGVIAPFQLQVLNIEEALQRLHLSGITVGSVEQFQRR